MYIYLFLSISLVQSLELEFPDYKNHECRRTCILGATPKTCTYDFTIENVYSMEPTCKGCPNVEADCYAKGCMPADGTSRLVTAINRMIPAPLIDVCKGDTVLVRLTNHLGDRTTAIHWHGIHQKNTQWMDGVPGVTQCGIQPLTSFTYKFIATEAGTLFYHAHAGFQRVQGAFGGLIVRVPKSLDRHVSSYNFDLAEHVVLFMDWFKYVPDQFYYNWYRMKNFDFNPISTFIVNGFGKSDNNEVTPYRFYVEKNLKYRFRFISNGAINCPTEIKIDNHKFTIISADGADVQKLENIDTFYMTSGERYDVIIHANQPNDLYWMRFKGYGDCNEVKGYAVLQYKGAPKNQKLPNVDRLKVIPPLGKKFNCFYQNTPYVNCTFINQLKALDLVETNLQGKPDVKIYLGSDLHPLTRAVNGGDMFIHLINNISFAMPVIPLLQNPEQRFCNANNTPPNGGILECMHGYEIPFNSLVELILFDKGIDYNQVHHPFHLHGYYFRVVGEGIFPNINVTTEFILAKDKNDALPRNCYDAPLKDTLPVGDYGYAIIRFRANNPGMWFYHCHIELHLDSGMALVFKVGNNNEVPKLPGDFPRCGNYYSIL